MQTYTPECKYTVQSAVQFMKIPDSNCSFGLRMLRGCRLPLAVAISSGNVISHRRNCWQENYIVRDDPQEAEVKERCAGGPTLTVGTKLLVVTPIPCRFWLWLLLLFVYLSMGRFDYIRLSWASLYLYFFRFSFIFPYLNRSLQSGYDSSYKSL
jgi:hypothetical protein